MQTSPRKIDRLIKEIKKRLKLRTLQHGISIILLTSVGFACLYLLGLALFELSALIQTVIITIAVVALVLEIGWFVVRPSLSTIEDQKIALLIEEKFPDMEDRINSAVELKGQYVAGKEESLIIDRLIDDATKKIGGIQFTAIINRNKERRLTYAAYGLFLLFILTTFSYMEDIRRISSNVEFTLNPKALFGQELINIAPGNIQIEKGESVDIIAELKASTDDELFLHYKMADDVWAKEKMDKSIDGKTSIFRMISIQEPTVYYVELREISSAQFNIELYEFPKVTQIDLRYDYPVYTGLPDRVEANTGNIRGLQGTEVTLTVQTSGAPIAGELVLKDDEIIKLTSQGNGVFQGKMHLNESGVYHIELSDSQEKNNKFPVEYQITAVEDALPVISINDPQRDVRVNAVEEVLIDVSVSDDFGVNNANLRFSVNGNEEESVRLFKANQTRETEIKRNHVFYLEDYSLEPGDVISYYVDAEDNFHITAPNQSDMYFIEVIPFDSKFTQLNNQGGGGVGQQGSQMVINQQTIINATWNLLRKKNELPKSEFDESVDAIRQSQSNLKENIDERINSTAFSVEMAVDDENKEIADLLRQSVEQMDLAVKELSEKELKKALTPERKALSFLLRADAKNKEKLIQRGQMTGGSGGGNSEDRMTELMDLELDISKDKYEIQQQNQQQQNQQLDETLQKLRELAKKQELLAQQNRENIQEQMNRRELDRLKRDQEQIRYDAENLANQLREQARNNDKISRQMQNRIDEITKNLRDAEQDLKNNNFQQAMARQSQAINELNKLQNDMRLSLSDDVRDMLDEFTDNFRELDEQERQLSNDISEEYKKTQASEGSVENINRLKNLTQKRERMIDKLNSLEDQARAIEESSRQENPKIATSLKNIQNSIQRENIEKNMRGSKELLEKGWLTYANMLEEEIKSGISLVEDQVKQLAGGMPVTEEQKLNRSLEDTRDLLQRFQEAMAQNQNPSKEQKQGQPQPGNNNRQEAQEGDQQQGGNSGRAGRNEVARMRSLLEQTRETLERMERDNQNDEDLRRQLNNTRRMFSPGNVGTLLGGKAEEYFKNKVYDPLSQLETYLLNRLDQIELEKKLYSLRKEEVPPEYKKMVDKYFESISK